MGEIILIPADEAGIDQTAAVRLNLGDKGVSIKSAVIGQIRPDRYWESRFSRGGIPHHIRCPHAIQGDAIRPLIPAAADIAGEVQPTPIGFDLRDKGVLVAFIGQAWPDQYRKTGFGRLSYPYHIGRPATVYRDAVTFIERNPADEAGVAQHHRINDQGVLGIIVAEREAVAPFARCGFLHLIPRIHPAPFAADLLIHHRRGFLERRQRGFHPH